ncbi:MAG: LysM peptidoglycan-binding domain-containing protein [Armatimonadota bacterium]
MISNESRYRTCILYKDGSNEFLGARPPLDTMPHPDDRFHAVIDGDRIDHLSYRYFGRADLWWVICDYNDIFFPLELPVGMVLRIPPTAHVFLHILD